MGSFIGRGLLRRGRLRFGAGGPGCAESRQNADGAGGEDEGASAGAGPWWLMVLRLRQGAGSQMDLAPCATEARPVRPGWSMSQTILAKLFQCLALTAAGPRPQNLAKTFCQNVLSPAPTVTPRA
ncbi:hypothetical protein GCM10029992_11580 [Glycomyces albus]